MLTALSDCTDCDMGHYCETDGLTSPLPCEIGTYSTTSGSTSSSNCATCRQGSFCSGGDIGICEAGYVCKGGNKNAQGGKELGPDKVECPAGSYCPEETSIPVRTINFTCETWY